MPDAANALSGLQTTRSRRSDKHSAIRQFHAPCRMRLTPYPADKLHTAVGLISTAHQAVLRTMPDAANALSGLQTTRSRRSDKHSAIRQFHAPCRMRLMPYPAYKLHAAVGLISCGNIGIWQIRPYPARFYLLAPDTPYLTASTHLQRALSPARRHFVRHALRLRLSEWLLHPTDESPMPAKSAQR